MISRENFTHLRHLCLLMAVLCVPVAAQSPQAIISGTVTDTQSTIIPNAEITAMNLGVFGETCG